MDGTTFYDFFFVDFDITGVNDIDDRWRSNFFEVFQKRPRVSPVRIRCEDTFGREINEFLEVSIHDDFLLVRVLQRLASHYRVLTRLKKFKKNKTLLSLDINNFLWTV